MMCFNAYIRQKYQNAVELLLNINQCKFPSVLFSFSKDFFKFIIMERKELKKLKNYIVNDYFSEIVYLTKRTWMICKIPKQTNKM